MSKIDDFIQIVNHREFPEFSTDAASAHVDAHVFCVCMCVCVRRKRMFPSTIDVYEIID